MSRFITYPSTIEKENFTILVIDATQQDIKRIELYLKVSLKDFDVYLYDTKLDDLQWVGHVTAKADAILINDNSTMQTNIAAIRYGHGLELIDPLAYFEQIDSDTFTENVI